MASTADDILEWKDRRGPFRLGGELLARIDDLRQLWESGGERGEYLDFFPIRLATLIEVFVRENIAEILDSTPSFLDKAEPLIRNARLDFNLAKSIHGQRLTLGEFVAHTVSVTDAKKLIGVYETLFDGFRKKLETTTERWMRDDEAGAGTPRAPILKDAAATIGAVDRLLRVRHILVHEVPAVAPYDEEEIPAFLAATHTLLSAIDWFVIGEVQGDIPLTQRQMNMVATRSFNEEEQAMTATLNAILEKDGADERLLAASQEAWSNYAKADTDLRGSLVAGGSMEPSIRASHMAELARERTKALRWWVEREEYDL